MTFKTSEEPEFYKFGDGLAEARIVYGDGSTGPFVHLTLMPENDDEATVALERVEVHEFANFLLGMIEDMDG